ncbi:MAG: pirin family protein [Acidobacteriota bacterium]|nr:pirin family protein [Acidobacteriota bacterium]MDH3529298.1 pirin family protein [Acidobacteriota bacterium]
MIETVIPYRRRRIGSMEVRRVLPYSKRRSVGPFVFVDDFGPFEIVNGHSMDVLPHPHIGLSTVTYLFAGNMTHRDSIGSVQRIRPGEVNWMTAGSGIVHSERVSDSGNPAGSSLSGLQTWIALPEKDEETEPLFYHHASDELPLVEADGASITLILGEFFGSESPVKTMGSPLYAKCKTPQGNVLEITSEVEERAVYCIAGSLLIENRIFGPGELVVFSPGAVTEVGSETDSVFMLLGGPALEKERHLYWNFVSTSKDRIESAKEDWRSGRFRSIPNEIGYIPLPAA